MSDPWAHRSAGMRCSSCMWWAEKVKEAEMVEGPSNADRRPPLGRCRRRAPTINGFPATFGHDWCGDHKLDENKT